MGTKRRYYRGAKKATKKGRTRSRTAIRRHRRVARRSGRGRYNLSANTHLMVGRFNTINTRCIGLPERMVAHLAYRAYDTVTTGASGASSYRQYRLNSLFDPYYTGVGNQPRYFDQLVGANLYTMYRVYKADVTVTIRARMTSQSDIQAFAMVRPGFAAPPTSPVDVFHYAEFPWTATRMLDNPADNGASRAVFRFTVPCHQILGMRKSQYYMSDDTKSLYNTNPAEVVMLSAGICDDPAETVANLNADMEVSIVYHAVLFDLFNNVPQS